MPRTSFRPATLFALTTLLLAACGGDSGPTTTTPVPAEIVAVQGAGQSGIVGQLLANELVVQVLDAQGQPVAGVSVTWSVSSGGGSLDPTSQATGSDGRASTSWTLGGTPGAQTVTARAGTLSTTFSATAAVGGAEQVVVSPGTGTLASLGATTQLQAEVRDAFGNLREDAVTWSSSAAGVASVDAQGVVTAVANGEATITATAGSNSGTAVITVQQRAATVTPSATSVEVRIDNSVELTVAAADANGHAVAAETFSWSVADANVATITPGSNGTTVSVAGAAIGSTTLTVTSGSDASVSATVAVQVLPGELVPTEDEQIGGTLTVSRVEIAEGVNLTVTDALELNSEGDVTIAGSLRGDCVPIQINAAGNLTITGDVENGCSDPSAPGVKMELFAAGAINLDGVTVKASGEVVVSNDPGNMAGPLGAALRNGALQLGSVDRTCRFRWFITEWIPLVAPPGMDGGSTSIYCNETMTLVGGNQLSAQWGGDAVTVNGVNVTGGNGGKGGGIAIQVVDGDIIFQNETIGGGQGTAVSTGKGGDGGDAEAVSIAPNVPAVAVGGNGAVGGLFGVNTSDGEIIIDGFGGLRVWFGDGGAGGDATAMGADGSNAGTSPAGNAGHAEATGGTGADGGFGELLDTSGRILPAGGPLAVTGITNIIQNGANGGRGGHGIVVGGKGGDGNALFPDGAAGGDMLAASGSGGNSINGLGDAPLGVGGDAGDLDYSRGMGGHGFDACELVPFGEGGTGGDGGGGAGVAGTPGTGLTPGADAGVTLAIGTGNGGDGGDGDGPGNGGPGGLDFVTNGTDPDVFQDGGRGLQCGSTVADLSLNLNNFLSSPGAIPPGTYTVAVSDGERTGTIQLTASGQTFWSNTILGGGPRFGFGNGGAITLNLESLQLEGAEVVEVQSLSAKEATGAANQTLALEITQQPASGSTQTPTTTTSVMTNSQGSFTRLLDTWTVLLVLQWRQLVFIDLALFVLRVRLVGG